MKKEVRIGIFAILMIGAAWAGVKFFSGIDVFSRNADYVATYEQIGGVQSASSVMIRGVKVGTVTGIEFDPSIDSRVYLNLSVQKRYKIPVDSKAKISSNGIMGGKVIEIVLGSSSEYLDSGEHIQTVEEVNIFATASDDFEALKEKLEGLNRDMTRTLENVNTLLESNNKHINGLLANLEGVSGNINSLLDGSKGDIGRVISGMADFSQTLGANSERMDSIMLNMTTISSQLSDANIGEGLSSTLGELNKTLSTLNSTDGSVGKMLRDEALYDNLTSATSSLDSLFMDLKENPKRYVHFSLFGRKDK